MKKQEKNFIRCRKPAPLACTIRTENDGRREKRDGGRQAPRDLGSIEHGQFTTRANLAFEFGVSKRTIDHDLLLLSRKYPIYAMPGKGGGIHIMDNFRLDGRYLTEEQTKVLVRLAEGASESDKRVIRSILKRFGKNREDRV